MRLIIVESPAKCSKIQGFLGLGNKVIASMGHIRALAHGLDAVGIHKGFEPTYEFMKEKASAIASLKAAAKDAESIILCSDDDREGEAIAYSLAVLLKLNPKTNPRAAFREITKNAVLDAVNKPRTIDMNRVNSQQARAMLDMMIGFTISPLLWKHLGGSTGLSAGRCQTPAVRLVCDREAGIDTFKSELSWAITGSWSALGGKAAWPATMNDALGDEESALNYLENHRAEPTGVIKKATVKPWLTSAPQALMTSTLQQQASNLYHCAPKRTMQIAQKLYEAGHITYMRTDTVAMSEEAVDDAKRVICAKWGVQYVHSTNADKKKKKKEESTAQEAHEAIRPTHFDLSKLSDSEDWGEQDRKIYHLVWLRAIQSIMSPATGETKEIEFEATGDEGDFLWTAKWKRTIFPGWKAADEKDALVLAAENPDEKEDEESAEATWKIIQEFKEGQGLKWNSLMAKPQETKAQGRFTEASLVRELEKKGIGRPSTFASLIATIVEKSYVEVADIPASTLQLKSHTLSKLNQWPPTSETFVLKRGGEKARMVPTPLGKSMITFATDNFPDLFAFEFTAGLESRLDKIAEGKEPWKKVLEDTWSSYKDRVTALKASGGVTSGVGAGGAGGTGNANPRRREFGDGLIAVITAKGPLLLKEGATKEETVFFGWPASKPAFQALTADEARAFILQITQQKQGDSMGEFNGHPIIKKKGPYGLYAECNGVRVNVTADDSLETVTAKLRAKVENPSRSVGPFQIRTGQYGPYLMKSAAGAGKKPQCVSIPAGTDLEGLTAQQAGEIFEAGLKAKATYKKRPKK
jgi:DNA topoisomerase-1